MAELEDNLVTMCFKDITTFCADASPGNSRVHSCLTEHHCDLSPSCQTHLERTAPRMPDFLTQATLPQASQNAQMPIIPRGGGLGGIFDMMNMFLNGGSDDAEEEPSLGVDPSTWAPVEPEEPEDEVADDTNQGIPLIGSDVQAWSPLSSSNMKPRPTGGGLMGLKDGMPPMGKLGGSGKLIGGPLGSDPRTWAPKNGEEEEETTEQQPLGSDPRTWAPKSSEEEEEEVPAGGRPLMGADPRTWSKPTTETRKQAAMPMPSVEVNEVSSSSEEEQTTAAQLMRLGLVAAGAAGLLVLGAVSHHASKTRARRRAHDEWRRSFAPALLA
jgi:hypothetical protein